VAGDGPLVVLFGEDGADEADDRGAVGEDADDVGAAADLFVEPLERVVAPELPPVLLREAGEGEQIGRGLFEQCRGASGKRVASWSTIRRCCSCTVAASGWPKIVRTIVATKLCALFGTRVSRLRMKCVRQRCQAAPGRVAEIASTRPGCASEMSTTANRKRRARPSRGQRPAKRPLLGGDDVKAERLAEAVPVDADRVHDADVDRAAALAALDHQRVQGHVCVGCAVERAGAEVLDDRVQALASLETWLLLIRSTPSCTTSFSTLRVETPAG